MKNLFHEIVIKLSALFTFIMGIILIVLGVAALVFMESLVRTLLYIAGIFLILLGGVLVSGMLLAFLFAKR